MHIKEVIIQGFRSYKEQTASTPFSKRLNVVVGKNGSGKSNFFKAIEFVLGDEDEYKRLGQSGRQQLLHEGTGDRVLSAWVEIIFDNSDNRMPIETGEVSLKRTIGVKKDQYTLNARPATKQDVVNLLESAGFSMSNPYYIVKQGKVEQLSISKDKRRLELLREVAGTRVYDERKHESENLLKENEERISTIRRLVDNMGEKLKALENDKDDLKRYQQLDRKRRALEFVVYNREGEEVTDKMTKLRTRRQAKDQDVLKYRSDLHQEQNKIANLERDMQEYSMDIEKYTEEKDQLALEIEEASAQKTSLELKISELTGRIKDLTHTRTDAKQALKEINAKIAEVSEAIEELTPRFQDAKKKEQHAHDEIDRMERIVEALEAKRSHGSRFKTAGERNEHIDQEIRKLNSQIKKQDSSLKALEKTLKIDENKVNALVDSISNLEVSYREGQHTISDKMQGVQETRKVRDELTNERTSLLREEGNLQQKATQIKRALGKKEQIINMSMGAGLLRGKESINKLLEEMPSNIKSKYYGLFINHLSCKDAMYNAVDTVAGAKLYYHIVEDEHVASALLDEFNRQKMPGELNFLPLRLLNPKGLSRDKLDALKEKFPNEAMPLVDNVQVDDPKLQVAANHVFGRFVLCKTLETATQVRRDLDCDCVTIEGHTAQRGGVMSGGYIDKTASRMLRHKEANELRKELEVVEQDLSQVRMKNDANEAAWRSACADYNRKDSEVSRRRKDVEDMQHNLSKFREEHRRRKSDIEQRRLAIESGQKNYESLSARVTSLEEEKRAPLSTTLSASEQSNLVNFEQKIRTDRVQLRQLMMKRHELEVALQEKTTYLNENLLRQLDDISRRAEDFVVNDTDHQRTSLESERQAVDQRLEELKQRHGELDNRIDERKTRLNSSQEDLDYVHRREKQRRDQLNEVTRELEHIAAKIVQLEHSRAECSNKIRQLGAVPGSGDFATYVDRPFKTIAKELDQTNKELKQFGHLNQSALDHFMQFSDEKRRLIERQRQLEKDKTIILDLISGLDRQKSEEITSTFRQMKQNFEEIFGELTNGGRGYLEMSLKPNVELKYDSKEEAAADVENWGGIGISCSFNSATTGETKTMDQLSGGQKTLVALALIFAIQRCDPAPFYLFDEVDQALDAEHRRSVGRMIDKLSEKAQFIVTTFRPELLEYAQKFYGVRFDGKLKVSKLLCVNAERAKDFISEDFQTDTSAPSSSGNETSDSSNRVRKRSINRMGSEYYSDDASMSGAEAAIDDSTEVATFATM